MRTTRVLVHACLPPSPLDVPCLSHTHDSLANPGACSRPRPYSTRGKTASSKEARARAKEEAELRKAFKVFDKDGSGALSIAEMRAVLTRPGGGAPLSDEEVAAVIAECECGLTVCVLRCLPVHVTCAATRTPSLGCDCVTGRIRASAQHAWRHALYL